LILHSYYRNKIASAFDQALPVREAALVAHKAVECRSKDEDELEAVVLI